MRTVKAGLDWPVPRRRGDEPYTARPGLTSGVFKRSVPRRRGDEPNELFILPIRHRTVKLFPAGAGMNRCLHRQLGAAAVPNLFPAGAGMNRSRVYSLSR